MKSYFLLLIIFFNSLLIITPTINAETYYPLSDNYRDLMTGFAQEPCNKYDTRTVLFPDIGNDGREVISAKLHITVNYGYIPNSEVCDDGIDNDGDGFFDCGDSDCQNDLSCNPDDGVYGPLSTSMCAQTDDNSRAGWNTVHLGFVTVWGTFIASGEKGRALINGENIIELPLSDFACSNNPMQYNPTFKHYKTHVVNQHVQLGDAMLEITFGEENSCQAYIPPDPPDAIQASVHGNKIKIQWDSVADAALYHLYYSTQPGVSNVSNEGSILGITETSYTLEGLTPGKEYYFIVTAENSYGLEGEGSNVVSVTTIMNISPVINSLLLY